MCIVLFSTQHPKYSLVILSNRDEVLDRPTKAADWWAAPNQHILGGRDLQRPEQGTWLGITRSGLIAVLTNFREERQLKMEARSRGAMVNAFLTQDRHAGTDTASFLKDLVENQGLGGIGGFSMVCGRIGEPLAVVSNRTPDVTGITWIVQSPGEIAGLSNALITEPKWPKVAQGEEMLGATLQENAREGKSEDDLIEALFSILRRDTLPRSDTTNGWESQVMQLKESLFIPPLQMNGRWQRYPDKVADAGSYAAVDEKAQDHHSPQFKADELYGTQRMTVILVDHEKNVKFIERQVPKPSTGLSSQDAHDRRFEFTIGSFNE